MSKIEDVFLTIESYEKEIVELETKLTAIKAMAPESNGDGEWEKAEMLQKWLHTHGISDVINLPAPDDRVSIKKRPNLVATIKGKSDTKRLIIMTHLDVVPEGDLSMWKTSPFKVEYKDGILYGRGVEDNQQGLVSSVFAALSLIKNNIVPEHTIKLLFVADEEVGSEKGIQFLLKEHNLFREDDLIIIPDGGCPDGSEIEVAEKNTLWLKVITKGKQCHGSVPDEGHNAFLASCDLALRVTKLENEYFTVRNDLFNPDRSTLSPTKKEANVPNINTIPGDDVFYFDCRILPEYKNKDVVEKIRLVMNDVEKIHGVTITLEDVHSVESKATKPDAPVVKALAQAIRQVYPVVPRAIGIGGGTVGAYLRNAGYDCVVWSTQNETAHQPNENASMKNIMGDAKVFALLMLRE